MITMGQLIRFKTIPFLLVVLSLTATPRRAAAQGPAGEEADAAEPEPADEEVIQLEELVVEGEIAKPDAFYILNRTSLGYEILDMRTSFLRDIVEAVEHDPF